MAWEYSEKTKQLFMDAVHGSPGTHLGEIEDPDGFGEHGRSPAATRCVSPSVFKLIRPIPPRT